MRKGKDQTKGEETMVNGKYLNPKADLTFKLVFGENEDLMMSLLNALLPLAEDAPITQVEYMSPELVPEIAGKKDSIVDVRCKDSLGRKFIVEMQMHWNEDFMKRVLLNVSKQVVKEAGVGENYRQIQPVFSLNLINDTRFQPNTDEFYHDYAVINVEHPERTIDGLRFIFVELPKFQPKSIAEKKMAVLWLRYLTEIGEETKVAPPELLENEETRKALSIVEKSAMSDEQLYAYEQFMMSIIDEQVLREAFYKEGMEEGMQKGIEKGMEKGIEKGMKKGLEKGRAEGIIEANRENARKMKADGISVDLIVRYTGLTAAEISTL